MVSCETAAEESAQETELAAQQAANANAHAAQPQSTGDQQQPNSQSDEDNTVWPTDSHIVTSPLGATNGRGAPHNGIDIHNPRGGNVYASDDGTVICST